MFKKKRSSVFIIFSDLGLGGIQKKIVEIADFLAKNRDKNVHIILRKQYDNNSFSFKSLIKSSNVFVHIEPEPIILGRFQEQYYLVFLIYLFIKFRPDVVLTFFFSFLKRIIYIKEKIFFKINLDFKIIVSVDSVFSKLNEADHIDSVFSKKHISKYLKKIDSIIVQTKCAKQDLVSLFLVDPKLIYVVPNWILNRGMKNKKRVEKKYDLIYIGRFAKQKKLELLIDIAGDLSKKRKLKVLFKGSGRDEEKIKKKIKDKKLSKIINIKSPSLDVSSFLLLSKILVLTSEFEGQPLVILEAMNLGIPVVAMKFPGVSEYVKTGETGFIARDKKEFIGFIELLLNDKKLRKLVGVNAQKYSEKNYSVKNLQKTANLLC